MGTGRPVKHTIRWYVWAWNGTGPAERLPHTATMRGTWGWDAECTCGWGSHTGGATRTSVRADVASHKWDVGHADEDTQAAAAFAALTPEQRLRATAGAL